jgi:hypothetical protein
MSRFEFRRCPIKNLVSVSEDFNCFHLSLQAIARLLPPSVHKFILSNSLVMIPFNAIQLVLMTIKIIPDCLRVSEIHLYPLKLCGPGQHDQYSGSLWAPWSRDRPSLGMRFYTLVQTGPGAHSASCTMGNRSLSRW